MELYTNLEGYAIILSDHEFALLQNIIDKAKTKAHPEFTESENELIEEILY